MGIGLLEFGVKMRKAVIFQIKVCYTIVWNHPFLVGMLCFLALLYRSFPFVFSLLVSLSPVLVCTAALLGTLLSYGHPNLPEFEKEEKTSVDVVPLKTGLSQDAARIVERNRVDESTDRSSDKLSEVHRGQRFGDHSPLVIGVAGAIAIKEIYERKNEKSGEKTGEDQYSKVDDEKSVDSFDSRRVNFDSPPGSPWEQEEEEEEEYEEALDSGSDRAESSSPDASIVDILPMLDELHPLLADDTPPTVSASQVASHAASPSSSNKSSDSDNESDDGSEVEEELEVADDENDDEEEETKDKEDPKSAITWTEEDQRNLMDLGSSELERNLRLESLIARRRARLNMSVVDEKNLIDLLTSDLPLNNIPPISTARNNPFDLPSDSAYNLGLPPIPSSAPSVLLPRRNPFDIPYDPTEEKPDLTGDTFQQEFITSHPKEQPFFRRHESFSVGPSIFGLNKQDKKDIHFRPYFVPDPMASEATNSYSPFQRHPSDLSDSKVSSVPETESQGSIEDLEDKNLTDEDVEEKILNEPVLISKIEASEDVGHGSQSSEEVECLVLGVADKKDNDPDELQNVENHHEVGPIDPSKIRSKPETSEQKCISRSSSSSSSSLSVESERIFADKEVVRLSSEEPTSHVETPSPNGSDLNTTTSSVDEGSHYEPIYDASPPSMRKNISSSIASDPLPETEMVLPAELVKRTVTFVDREPLVMDSDELDVARASAPAVPMLDSKAFSDSKSSTKEPSTSLVDSIKEASTKESSNVSEIQKAPSVINSPRSPESFVEPPNAKVATEESSMKNGSIDNDVHAGESKGKGASLDLQNVGKDSLTQSVLKNHIDKPETGSQQESETGPSKAGSSNDSGSSNVKKLLVSEKIEADAGKVVKATTTEKPNHAAELPQQTGVVTEKEKPNKSGSTDDVKDEKEKPNKSGSTDDVKEERDNKSGSTDDVKDEKERPNKSGSTDNIKDEKEKPNKSGSTDDVKDEEERPNKSGSTDGVKDEREKPNKSGSTDDVKDEKERPNKSGFTDDVEDEKERPNKSGSTGDNVKDEKEEPNKSGSTGDVKDGKENPSTDDVKDGKEKESTKSSSSWFPFMFK